MVGMTSLGDCGQAIRPPLVLPLCPHQSPSPLLSGLSCLHSCEQSKWAFSLEAVPYPLLDSLVLTRPSLGISAGHLCSVRAWVGNSNHTLVRINELPGPVQRLCLGKPSNPQLGLSPQCSMLCYESQLTKAETTTTMSLCASG